MTQTLGAVTYRGTQTLGSVTRRGTQALGSATRRGTQVLGAVTSGLAASAPSGFDWSVYGTLIGDYKALDAAADGGKVSIFPEVSGSGPTMSAPASSNEGTYEAATSSVLFDGSDDHYTATTTAFDTLHTAMTGTIATRCWISGGGAFQGIFGSARTTAGTGALLWTRVGRAILSVHNGSGWNYVAVQTGAVMSTPGLYSIIVSYSLGGVRIWIDGVLQITSGAITGTVPTGPASVPYTIGAAGDPAWYFNSQIRRLVVLSTEIDPADVAAITTELAA